MTRPTHDLRMTGLLGSWVLLVGCLTDPGAPGITDPTTRHRYVSFPALRAERHPVGKTPRVAVRDERAQDHPRLGRHLVFAPRKLARPAPDALRRFSRRSTLVPRLLFGSFGSKNEPAHAGERCAQEGARGEGRATAEMR